MTSILEVFITDLQRNTPNTSFIPHFLEDGIPLRDRIRSLYRQLLRSKRLMNRTLMIFYAFQIGYTLEVLAETPLERALCQRELTGYYNKVAKRTYYIFEPLGEEQIFRTQNITLAIISRIGHDEYLELIEEALNEARKRLILQEQDLLGGEDC